jgi:SAM-dependent methyltransferase
MHISSLRAAGPSGQGDGISYDRICARVGRRNGRREATAMGTLEYYDANAIEYSDETFGNDTSDLRLRFAGHLAPGARIMDLGCGSCRDTVAFAVDGYEVVPVDGSEGFVRSAMERLGIRVLNKTFDSLDLEGFDGVWACASLLHVRSEDMPEVMARVRRSLNAGGVLFCSFKEGSFEGERDGRWYNDQTAEGLTAILGSSGFRVLDLWSSVDVRGTVWVCAVSSAS